MDCRVTPGVADRTGPGCHQTPSAAPGASRTIRWMFIARPARLRPAPWSITVPGPSCLGDKTSLEDEGEVVGELAGGQVGDLVPDAGAVGVGPEPVLARRPRQHVGGTVVEDVHVRPEEEVAVEPGGVAGSAAGARQVGHALGVAAAR